MYDILYFGCGLIVAIFAIMIPFAGVMLCFYGSDHKNIYFKLLFIFLGILLLLIFLFLLPGGQTIYNNLVVFFKNVYNIH